MREKEGLTLRGLFRAVYLLVNFPVSGSLITDYLERRGCWIHNPTGCPTLPDDRVVNKSSWSTVAYCLIHEKDETCRAFLKHWKYELIQVVQRQDMDTAQCLPRQLQNHLVQYSQPCWDVYFIYIFSPLLTVGTKATPYKAQEEEERTAPVNGTTLLPTLSRMFQQLSRKEWSLAQWTCPQEAVEVNRWESSLGSC